VGDRSLPAGSRSRAPAGVWGRDDENNCQKHRLLVGQSKNNQIVGFGGRPGARPPKAGPGLNNVRMQRITPVATIISTTTVKLLSCEQVDRFKAVVINVALIH